MVVVVVLTVSTQQQHFLSCLNTDQSTQLLTSEKTIPAFGGKKPAAAERQAKQQRWQQNTGNEPAVSVVLVDYPN